MFKKLLSNLPFNPSLIGQIGFYSKRLKKEASIRRLGVVFVVLSLMIQIIATVSPSESTLARSGNDMIPGGFSSQGEAVNLCKANKYNLKTILKHFQIDCLALYYGKVQTINSRDHGGNLYSMGRLPYGKPGEVSVSIPGAGTFYMRPLKSWDTGSSSSYKAITGKSSDGKPFMILFNCGNLTIIGPPAPPPPPPPPPPKIVKCTNLFMSVENNSEIKLGSSVTLTGQASGKNINQKKEKLNMYYRLFDESGKNIEKKSAVGIGFKGGVATDPSPRVFQFTKEGKYTFKLRVTRNNNGSPLTIPGSDKGNCVKKVTVKKDLPCIDVSDDDDVTACLILSKKVKNETQNISDANDTVANASDVIVYTLYVKNTSNNTAAKGFVIEENISDILEYADIVDLDGGTKNSENIVQWPAVDIDVGATVEKQITVKIKNPIPKTPISSSNPGSYDCVMTNVYSDTVNVRLKCGIAKTTEQIGTTLPNTGPGETLAVSFAITVVAGYFFARAKLMNKELETIKVEYTSGGQN